MRAVIQRVTKASVTVDDKVTGSINAGMLVLLGIEDADTTEDIIWLSNKITNLRIFNDAQGVMNQSVKEMEGNILLVSQFTLYAATKKGNRPSHIRASKPDIAIPLYEQMITQLGLDMGKQIFTGIFGADMKVELLNDGPVTIIIDTKKQRMTIQEAQEKIDGWIKTVGVRYFSELTNMAILTEEVGEVARIMARKYGDQSSKESDQKKELADELADVLWVLFCIANQTGIDMTEALEKNFEKKNIRDATRHKENRKLQ
jgi:D-tyrosyl-tRNA(Tyr) deacylase